MERRDFFKSFAIAVAAFATYRPTLDRLKQVAGHQPSEGFWRLQGVSEAHEIQDELGRVTAIISFGHKIKITKTFPGDLVQQHEPLSVADLNQMRCLFGLPAELADHLSVLGLKKFLQHQTRCYWDSETKRPVAETDWVAWLDPEQMESLCHAGLEGPA